MSDFLVSEHEPTSSGIPSIGHKDFPSLYQNANQAAIQTQQKCFNFRLWHLIFLILGSGGAVLATMIPEAFSTWFHVGIVIILLIGFVINIVSRVLKYDEKWFNYRAIAESIKTATWRFMMKASPFEEDSTSEKTFRAKISEIQSRRQFILGTLAPYQDSEAKLISSFMKDMRRESTEDRKNKYLRSRLLDQKTWYTKKANYNLKTESHWFYATIGLQFLAVVLAILQSTLTTWSVNLVSILMTCIAASIAWSRMKRHSELAQNYALTAEELGELEAGVSNVTQESEFIKFVNNVEYAISREHTMWCIRQEVIVDPNNQE